MLGPAALEHITDFASRHSASPDALVTMIQLAYMKHFSQPLSALVHDEILRPTSSDTENASPALLAALHARLLAASGSQVQAGEDETALLSTVSAARAAFHRTTSRLRVAFACARIAERIALGDAAHATANGKSAEGRNARLDSHVRQQLKGEHIKHDSTTKREEHQFDDDENSNLKNHRPKNQSTQIF